MGQPVVESPPTAARRVAWKATALALLPLCLACKTPIKLADDGPAPPASRAKPEAVAAPRLTTDEGTAKSGTPTEQRAAPRGDFVGQPPPATPTQPQPEPKLPGPIVQAEFRAPPIITPPPAERPRLPRPNGTAGLLDEPLGVPSLSERLQIPPEFPGANAAQLTLPPRDPDHPEQIYPIIDALFPNLPPVWPLKIPTPGPQTPAVSLAQLQQLAIEYNPELVQFRADITSMYGDAVQAGTHPNPIVGYESDTVGSSKSRDYQGVYFTQWIKTAGKLSLARAVKNYDVMNAQLALRRMRISVLAQVKSKYFAVLVAQENVAVMSGLVRFTDEVYRIQTEKLKAGWAAAFEPAQLRSLADLAKVLQVQAQNRYISAWKQLVAIMGVPLMEYRPLEGRADMPIPVIAYEGALGRMLTIHPDVLIGRNMESKARVALRLAELTPVPDVYLYGTFQKDFTTPNYINTSYNLQLGVPLPIWDRNKGGIISARGDLLRASQQMRVAQIQLTAQLADAFERYETARIQLQFYRNHILPDLARAYRGVYEQHQQQPADVGFEGIIVAQGNLANAITTYIATLNAQWTAVADLANLMQVEDFAELSEAGRGAMGTQPNPGQPVPGQPFPGQPFPGQPAPGRPGPRRPGPAGPPPANPLPAPGRKEGRP
ncbi:MAG TPA: TolC family protein [Pirellulales bacterium]|nr:TolC family protein [Pirellulales bacterium]